MISGRRGDDAPATSRAARAFLRETSGRPECEHIAALLKSPDDVPAVAACFLGLGAARNGWLVYGSLPGDGERDRTRLADAGLEVAELTARGQLEIMDLDLSLSPDEWVRPWAGLLEARLAAGFDALWFARFPVVLGEKEISDILPYEDAWMRTLSGRRVVTLCPYISAEASAVTRPAHADKVASVHDRLLDLGAA